MECQSQSWMFWHSAEWISSVPLPNRIYNNKTKVVFLHRSTSMITINYAPYNLKKANGILQILNPLTNEVFKYILTGVVKEATALDHIILKCLAR